MEYLQEITLELNSNTAYTTVGAKQGDHQSRNIKIHITQNGEDWEIPAGVSASYRIRKPDGYAIWNEALIDFTENVVYINLTEQALAVPGRAYADLLFVSGESSDKQILSTVSFIIIIMAAPNIIDNITSTNEFGEIIDLTKNAKVILNESEAWAIGERAGQPVAGDYFEYHALSDIGIHYTIDSAVFRNYVGIEYGRTIIYTFTCIENATITNPYGVWQVEWNDNIRSPILTGTPPADRPIPDNDTYYMSDYGFSFTEGFALQADAIQVTVTDHDIQFENNAKYYAEQAEIQEQKLENLTVSATSGIDADVVKEDNPLTGSYNLKFYLPKGDPGDVNLMTFYIDLDSSSDTYGEIISCRPDGIQAANIESYPSSMAISFDKNKFISGVNAEFGTYTFIYDLTSYSWYLNEQPVALSNYGISYTIKSGQTLLNGDQIIVHYFEQIIFSIDESSGELILELNTEG